MAQRIPSKDKHQSAMRKLKTRETLRHFQIPLKRAHHSGRNKQGRVCNDLFHSYCPHQTLKGKSACKPAKRL